MNTSPDSMHREPPRRSDPLPQPAPPLPSLRDVVRHHHRQRDFGIGYGNSSGYGSELHYGDRHADPMFRCV